MGLPPCYFDVIAEGPFAIGSLLKGTYEYEESWVGMLLEKQEEQYATLYGRSLFLAGDSLCTLVNHVKPNALAYGDALRINAVVLWQNRFFGVSTEWLEVVNDT